jgi:hypothetical protein
VKAVRTAGAVVTLAIVLVTTIGGCSWHHASSGTGARSEISQQTMGEVKVVVKGIEQEVAAFVPPDLVTGEVESTDGSLTGCAPGAASWGSHTALPVSRPPAFRELADDLREHWSRVGDFDVELTEGSTGEPRLILRSPVLGNYYVEMIEEFLQVASFSTCFAYDAERDGYDWEIGAE